VNERLVSGRPPAALANVEWGFQAWGARREVAVLFCDISGFTRLVETFDPEIVYRMVRPLMDELVRLVHQHGGEIQQVLGDGFMALFGLRDGHGREAETAVEAGLALMRAGADGVGPQVHVGIEYGEVLVTPSWQPADFGVWGRPVNLAKRLCDLAGPGEAQIGPAAFARAGHLLGAARPVRLRVKGVAAAVVAHQLPRGAPPGPARGGVSHGAATAVMPRAARWSRSVARAASTTAGRSPRAAARIHASK
jgi:class 3 adenylate cyclase